MSAETSEWLNRNTLIGMTDKRGTAWHYRASDQGDEPNHYPGPIPVADVHRRLFYWEARPVRLALVHDDLVGIGEDGAPVYAPRYDLDPVADFRAIQRSDTGQVWQLPTAGYTVHQYQDVLLRQAEAMLGEGLVVASAGLLKGGGRAWVCAEIPETFTVAGLDVRPSLIAASSHDGSLALTFKLAYGVPVCDNTLSMALMEPTPVVRFRHTSGSSDRIAVIADALGLVEEAHARAARNLDRLATVKVLDPEFDAIAAALLKPGTASKNAMSIADRQRTEVRTLWDADDRVASTRGTALGVVQTFNTWRHHVQTQRTRGITHRSERNMIAAITGTGEAEDRKTVRALTDVLGKERMLITV